ncbi:MAG: alpha/beta hydrolase [Acidobacteria bacterium]|nr:alpha/beta hydrolase [Acidobacteriota bacterium]
MLAAVLAGTGSLVRAQGVKSVETAPDVLYKTVRIDGLDIFYREAGDRSKPTILLLHGFPTSSHMFRNLIPELAGDYHLLAPDLPGFGLSSAPKNTEFGYTFENLTNIVDKFAQAVGAGRYSLYVQDYGAPVGFRLAVKHPERVQALIVQNGNAYEIGLSEAAAPLKIYGPDRDPQLTEALRGFLKLETTKFQYTSGTRRPERISPDNWLVDQPLLDREGEEAIQLDLFADYYTNVRAYPSWHEYFRRYQPPTLVVWGKNDPFFTVRGVEEGYRKDLKDIEVNYFDTGHFALEEDFRPIAAKIRDFLSRRKIR